MKSFCITIRMGRSDILDSEIADDVLQTWLQDKLEHATSLLCGNGRVRIERVDPLRVDVDLNFTVKGSSVADVMERFRDDFRALSQITQGVEISETKKHRSRFRTADLH